MDKKTTYFSNLFNLSPVDGREVLYTQGLRRFLSEGALHWYRAKVEISLLVALSKSGLQRFPMLSDNDLHRLEQITYRHIFDSTAVAEYDHFTRNGIGPLEHDVKAVEMYLRERFDNYADLEQFKELIHFPATSEDINNLAENMMIRDSLNDEWLPKLLQFGTVLSNWAYLYRNDPVLGLTHGMPASPTTFGKRFAYFTDKLTNSLQQLQTLRLTGKFSGPVGNHNAMKVVAPDFDMEGFAKEFVESFGFTYDDAEHQRNAHVSIARLMQEISLINIMLRDFCEHVRLSVMMNWYSQDSSKSGVGSSVMPHKINPWFFEVAQGYLEQSTSMINDAIPNLVMSLFERDLTDHPWERSYGEMIGKSLIGICYIIDGLETLRINKDYAKRQLESHPEVLTEAVQIAGRLCGTQDAYMAIKDASRGKQLTLEGLHELIDAHIPDKEMAKRLKSVSVADYTGHAAAIAERVSNRFVDVRNTIRHGILLPMTGIQAVLFDFDQTLHFGDKEEITARLAEIAENLQSGFTEEEIKNFGNRSDYREMVQLMVAAHNEKFPDRQITKEQFAAENAKVSGTLDHHFYLADGAISLLNMLQNREYKIGLVTTRGSNSLPRLLKKHGIEGYFDAIVCRDDTDARKPSPEPLMRALKKMDVPGTQAVYIGDKLDDDVPPALMLGMKAILVSPLPCHEYMATPTIHCSSLRDLEKYFME